MISPQLSERNQAEVLRSASEASKVVLRPTDQSQLERYLKPSADTPYGIEYAFYLLGDIRGKTVLDLGCGTGENIVPLLARGAQVIGIDISPDLISIAQRRLAAANLQATLSTGDAYDTGLPDESVDFVFCMALVHHLDIKRVRDEMYRILRSGGSVILREPIRFSKGYDRLRKLLPAQADISEYEHPLTREELETLTSAFKLEGTRYFRLPFVPLISPVLPTSVVWRASNWILRHWPRTAYYASGIVTKLRKQ